MFFKIVNVHVSTISCIEWVILLIGDFIGFPLSIILLILEFNLQANMKWEESVCLLLLFVFFLSPNWSHSDLVVASTLLLSVEHISEPVPKLIGYGPWPVMTLEISQVVLLDHGYGSRAVSSLPAFLGGQLHIRVAQVFFILFSTSHVQGLPIKQKE